MKNMNNIIFDERFDSVNGNTTLYFTPPKKILNRFLLDYEFPKVISMEICIDFPTQHIEPEYALISVSPGRQINGGTEDYDWYDVDMSYE